MSNLLNFCRMTSSTGGTGALTCTARNGYPDIAKAITGTRFVNYNILQFTDAAQTQLSKAEDGIGSYVASTGVLTRTVIKATWDGTDYLPKFGTATAPTALSFGTTAANIDIIVGPTVAGVMPPIPFYYGAVASVSDGLGVAPWNFAAFTVGSIIRSSGVVYYTPVYIGHSGPFSQVSIRSTVALTGGSPTFNIALYEISSSGVPGKRLISFTQFTGFQAIGTYTSTALATPIDIPPGWYWMGNLYVANSATGNFTPRSASLLLTGPQGGLLASANAHQSELTLSGQTVLNDPATAPTGNNGNLAGLLAYIK